ncbi:MAG: hypothetical protein AB7V42_12020 [Thermoleophilia bacterium]
MPSTEWIIVGSCLLIGTICLVRLPSFWRDRWGPGFDQPDEPPEYWPFGVAGWHAYKRAYPFSCVAVTGLGVVMVPVALFPGDPATDDAATAAGIPLLIWVVLITGFGLGLLLWNRPKWIVAPRHRAEPGALLEWRRRRRPRHPLR